MKLRALGVFVCLLAARPAAADLTAILAPGTFAAPGLGGDPFRRPAREGAGDWRGVGTSERRWQGFSLESSQPLLPAATGSVEWRQQTWRATVGERLAIGRRTLQLSAVRTQPEWNTRVGAGSAFVRSAEAETEVDLAVRLEEALPGFALQAMVPTWRGGRERLGTPHGVGASWSAGEWLRARADWNGRSTNSPLAITAQAQSVPTRIETRAEQSSVDLDLCAGTRLGAGLEYRRLLLIPESRSERTGLYELAPTGVGTMWRSAIRMDATESVQLLLRRTRGSFDGAADARAQGLRFGRLSYLRGELESWLVGAEARSAHHRFLLDLERSRLELGARATVESWPFTSLLADFLGLRRTTLVSAHVTGWRAHLAAERTTGERLRWRAGIAAHDLAPDGWVTDWRSIVLGLGVADLATRRLEIHRVQLGALSAGASVRALGFEVAADAQQFVFAKLFRSARATEAGSPGAETVAAQPAPASRTRGWPGGTWLAFSVRHGW